MSEKAMYYLIGRLEDKLKELMDEDEYETFTSEAAREALRIDLAEMPDSDFKDFAIKNLDWITRMN